MSTKSSMDSESPLLVRLAANTIIQVVGSVASSLISFFTFVAVTRGLGPDAFGNFTAATVFLFIPVVLADVGLSSAVLREISTSPHTTERVMRSSFPLRGVIAALAVGGIVAMGLVIPFNDQTRVAIMIGSIGAFFTLMELSLQPFLQAQLKMHWVVLANISGRSVSLGLTLAALESGLGFNGVVFAIAAGPAITFIVELAIVRRLVSLRPIFDLVYWRGLVRGSLVLGLAMALGQVYFRIDALLIAFLRPAVEVGLYGAAYKFIELAGFVMTAIGLSIFPSLARYVSTNDPRLNALFQKSLDISLTAAVPLSVIMFAFPSQIISLSAGSEFKGAESALQLLAPYPILMFASALLARFLVAGHREHRLLVISIAVLFLNITLNVIFLPIYGFKAAAIICLGTEVGAVAMLAALIQRVGGPLPSVRYLGVIATAGALMLAVALTVPGPPLGAAGLAVTAYAAALLFAPGTVRDAFRQLVVEMRRPTPQE